MVILGSRPDEEDQYEEGSNSVLHKENDLEKTMTHSSKFDRTKSSIRQQTSFILDELASFYNFDRNDANLIKT